MSRIDYHEDADFDDVRNIMAMGRFERNTKVAPRSKKGQKALRRLEAALLAMPQKRLAAGVIARPVWQLADEYEVCALGALAVHEGIDPLKLWNQWLDDEDGSYTADEIADELGPDLGMTPTLAWMVMDENDEVLGGKSPEERWERMLVWVRRHLK